MSFSLQHLACVFPAAIHCSFYSILMIFSCTFDDNEAFRHFFRLVFLTFLTFGVGVSPSAISSEDKVFSALKLFAYVVPISANIPSITGFDPLLFNVSGML